MSDRPSRPGERIALSTADLTDAEMAAILASVPDGPGYDLADLDDDGRLLGGLSSAYDPADARLLEGMLPLRHRPTGHVEDAPDPAWLALSPEDQAAVLDGEALYNIEDGPGAGVRLELAVRVLVGTERSTVILDDPVTGRALNNTVVAHGSEPGAAAAAVEAAVRAWLP